MPTVVNATASDTLCGLAMDRGFLNCDPIRNEPANAGKDFLNRDLIDGDQVTVPDITTKSVDKPSETKTKFKKKNVPGFSLRFVHGSPDKHYREDAEVQGLDVSNFVTTKGGANGQAAFPADSAFHQAGHVDPDTFKVEVVDPAGPSTVEVLVEALKPLYDSAKQVTGHDVFTGSDHDARSVKVKAKRVPSAVCYRSPYLRLVVDDADKNALPKQTLLVTDMADGQNTANDVVEILDQQVRASYEREKCPASHKCRARAEAILGTEIKKIRMAIHIFRAAPGTGTTGVNGITEQMVRRRTFKWFRRAYAQASLMPKLVAPEVEFVNPPTDDMLVISQNHGNEATGTAIMALVSGQPIPPNSSLNFTISSPPSAGPVPPNPPKVSVNLIVGPGGTPITPDAAGALIKAALPAGFSAEVFPNQRAFNAAHGSCDVIIKRDDGNPVQLTGVFSNDSAMTLEVANVSVAAVNVQASTENEVARATLLTASMQMRRIARAAPGAGDQLDILVIGTLVNLAGTEVARGIAMVPGLDLLPDFQPRDPCVWAALLTSQAMDGSDNNPFSYPHEAGHIMLDSFHVHAGKAADPNLKNQLMRSGTSETNVVAGSKRICDTPIEVQYDAFDPDPAVQAATPGKAKTIKLFAVPRIRDKGQKVQEG